MATITGSDDNDFLTGFDEADFIYGFAGDDQIFGGGGNDIIRPGSGSDTVDAGTGNDRIEFDVLGETTVSIIQGGDGVDTLDLSDVELSNAFFPFVYWRYDTQTSGYTVEQFGAPDGGASWTGIETLVGTDVEDDFFMFFAPQSFTIRAGKGNDRIDSGGVDGSGVDRISGGMGDDSIDGGRGRNLLFGDAGDDTIRTAYGSGQIDGGRGTDTVNVGQGLVDLEKGIYVGDFEGRYTLTSIENVEFFSVFPGLRVFGDEGDNQFRSQYSDGVMLDGRGGDDLLEGGMGVDTLIGGTGDDRLFAAGGIDTLRGGDGFDTMRGGVDADTFIFGKGEFGTDAALSDRIGDFNSGQGDIIDLTRVDANSNARADQDFVFVGTAAFTGVAGELRYAVDAEGALVSGDLNGDGAADFTIRLDGVTALTAADFVL